MRWEYIGTGLAILAIGITVMLALPPPWWPKMPTPLIQIGVVLGLILAVVGFGITGLGTWPGLPEPRGPVAMTLLGGVFLALGLGWWGFAPGFGARTLATHAQTSEIKEISPASHAPEKRPLTMRQLFDSDFPGFGKVFSSSQYNGRDGKSVDFAFTEYFSIPTSSFFLSFYFGDSDLTLALTRTAADRVPQIIRQLSQIEFEVSSPGEKRLVNNKTMKFSNQIYIYFDQNFSLRELSDVEAYFTSRGYSAIIRTNDYHVLHWSEFDRFSVGSTSESPTGAQLPKVDAGTQVSIKNRIGTEPFLSTDPPNPHPSAPAPRR